MGVVEKDDQAKACYEILKQNSLPSLQEFISQQPDDEKVFQSLASAMTNLSVRNIRLSMEVSLFVRWKLSAYAYRQLSGDWPMGELDDWKAHIAVISGCWRDIIAQTYHDNDSVDDRLLHRLRMIHNHLYFIQFKKFLADLPVWEIVFCVAIFINTYVEPNNYRFYRLMISKRMLMEWLGAFVPALERVQGELEQMEPVIRTIASDEDECRFHPLIDDLISQLQASTINNKEFIVGNFRQKRESAQGSKVELAKEVLKKLKRQENYDAMKDRLKALESSCGRIARIKEELERIVHPKNVYDQMMAGLKQKTPTDTIVNKIIADAEFSFTDLLQPEVMASIRQCYRQMKQFYSLVKIHECIAIITKLEPTNNKEHFVACVKRILTVMGEAINNTKNTPNMPDTRVHAAVQQRKLRVEREWMLLKLLPKHMRIVGVTLELLLIAIGAIIRHSFYGMLARSPTLESLRALLIQVDEEDIFRQAADDWWEDVNTYYRSASELLDQESRNPVGQTSQFQEAAHAFNHQKSIVEQLKRMALQEETFNYESVWKTCFACNDLSTVKHLLLRKLNSYNPSDVLDEMSNAWDANIPALSHIAWENRQLLQLNPTMAATCILTLQNELIKADHYVYAELTKELITKLGGTIAGDELQQLTTKLVPYYKNLFRLDLKRDVLEKFCQSRNLPFDRANLREQDQRELQQMFDDRRARLRSLFEQCGIHTTEDLSARLLQVPSDVIVAMEYVQVELCEMLLAVQYFGDNFPALKHSIPMIQGKSFRNYLAHDALSYDTLTCSGKEKCVINAFIFAHTPVSLFDKRTVTVPSMSFPSLEDTKQWIEQQLDLRDAVVAGDESRMNAGGEMMGQYYDSLDTRLCRTRRHSITDFVNWSDQFHPNVAALLSRYFADFEATFHDRNRRMNNALDRRDFEKAYELYKDLNYPNEINVRKSLLAWPGLPADFIEQMVSQYEWQPVLRTLMDYGNEQGAQLHGMVDLIRCIKRIDLERWYNDPSAEHPFAVAIEHEQESKEMYEVLESLGFDCFDNPTLLQTTIMEGSDHFLWDVIWTRMDENLSRSFEMYPHPFRLLMKVLHRWQWIAFVEKPYDGDTALSSAVKADNTLKVLDELINRARTMRTLEGDGLVLGGVAICSTIGPTMIVPNGYLELGQIYRLFTRYEYQTELQWQAVPLIEIGKLSIKFLVLDATMFNLDEVSHLQMRDTAALADNLLDLQTISNALFGQCPTVHATVAMGARTLHFWRIQDWCCAYDTLQYHAERPIDLSNMVNTKLAHGRTVLYQAIKYGCEIDSIQLLLEIGANPLLADEYGATAIVAAIERTQDPNFAVYLLNACAAYDYRNEVGEMIGEPGDRGLLDYAEAFGHQKAVRLLNSW
uniref:Uncharacterized protein n=1 Tax=Anopheles culicifacies TaxID=139723 RepID=A0A182M7C7_9DIPT